MFRPLPLRFSICAVALLSLVLGTRLLDRQRTPGLRIILPEIEGDAALILTPDDRAVLIDGGADGAALATWLGNTLPFGQRSLDAIVLTRADANTLPGQIATLKRYSVGTALLPPTERQTSSLNAWLELVEGQGIVPQTITANDQLRLGACALRILAESDGNAVLTLQCEATTAYFMQSLNADLEAALEGEARDPAALVVYPWQQTTQTALLETLQPFTVVFSEGGYSKELLTWQDRRVGAAQLYHETINGQITLVSDDAGIRVDVERKE